MLGPHRGSVSSETWHQLFSGATENIDIPVCAGGFLIEALDFADVLRWNAGKVRR
jgi:hypothetical protein